MDTDFSSLLIGVALGIVISALYVSIKVTRALNELDLMLEKMSKAEEIEVVIEKENGIYYCYEKQDRQFICQGRSIEEFRQAFRLARPGKTAYITEDNIDIIKEFTNENTSS
jgi:hypothetical protein